MASAVKSMLDAMRHVARLEAKSVCGQSERGVRELVRAVKAIEQRIARLETAKPVPVQAAAVREKSVRDGAAAPTSSFSSKSVKELRAKLGVSQREMALLVGVSTQAVYLWERRGGPLRLRNSTRKILCRLMRMGRREVRAELAGR